MMGQMTTLNTGSVAAVTLDAALQGHAVVIPGLLNRILHVLGGLVPPALIARLVAGRWLSAHHKRRLAASEL
jgi:hypothetical protein